MLTHAYIYSIQHPPFFLFFSSVEPTPALLDRGISIPRLKNSIALPYSKEFRGLLSNCVRRRVRIPHYYDQYGDSLLYSGPGTSP